MSDDEDIDLRLEMLQNRRQMNVSVPLLELALDYLAKLNIFNKRFAFCPEETTDWLSSKFPETPKGPGLLSEVKDSLSKAVGESRVRQVVSAFNKKDSTLLYYTASPNF